MSSFSIKECVRFGWKTYWTRPWFFILAGVVTVAVSSLFSIPQDILMDASDTAMDAGQDAAAIQFLVGGLIFMVLSAIVSTFIQMGTINFVLKTNDDVASVTLRDLIRVHPFWKYVGANILMVLAVIGGLILLIIPGIIIMIALSFIMYLVIDQNLGPVKAFKKSFALTKGHRWKILGFVMVLIGINILGLLALIVGLIVTIPVSMFASAHLYRTLLARYDAQGAAPVIA